MYSQRSVHDRGASTQDNERHPVADARSAMLLRSVKAPGLQPLNAGSQLRMSYMRVSQIRRRCQTPAPAASPPLHSCPPGWPCPRLACASPATGAGAGQQCRLEQARPSSLRRRLEIAAANGAADSGRTTGSAQIHTSAFLPKTEQQATFRLSGSAQLPATALNTCLPQLPPASQQHGSALCSPQHPPFSRSTHLLQPAAPTFWFHVNCFFFLSASCSSRRCRRRSSA